MINGFVEKLAAEITVPGIRALHGIVTRREVRRNFGQLIGTYLSFHKTVGNELNEITVNVLEIYPRFFGIPGQVRANFFNLVHFRNGSLRADFSYSGYATKGDQEFWL